MTQKSRIGTYWILAVSTLIILSLLFLATDSHARDVPIGTGVAIDDNFDGAFDVFAADIDGDGDLDVLGAAATEDDITWWKNTNGDASAWASDVIDGSFTGAHSVHAADMDGDGDLDVLGAAAGANEIAWWENTNGDGSDWDKHSVDAAFGGAIDVYAADVDGDGDMDVMGAAYDDNDFTWWENTGDCNGLGGACTFWPEHLVYGTYLGAHSVYAADMDRDGDLDMLVAAYGADAIAWYENEDGVGTDWEWRGVDTACDGARDAYAADMDGDGDLDVVGTGWNDDDIVWWENTNGVGTAWTEHPVKLNWDGAYAVHAADMDGDGDIDLLGTAQVDAEIAWWENNGPCTGTDGACTTWGGRYLETEFYGANSVYAADLDGDGDLDVLGTANTVDDITWWENETLHRSATYPGDGKHTVAPSFDGTGNVYAADIDGDGDADLLGTGTTDEIAWWENADLAGPGSGDGSDWDKHSVDTAFDSPRAAYAADVDGDGDLDILGAAAFADEITWWENTGPCSGSEGSCSDWTKHPVDTSFNSAYDVYAADVDGDGDLDVLGAASGADEIAWWENTGPCAGPDGACSDWTKHRVKANFDVALEVHAADMDGDGDLDILGAARDGDTIKWWENTGPCTGPGGACGAWTEHTVDAPFLGASGVQAADLDGDGDLDVLGTAEVARDIAWWENTGPCSDPDGACRDWTKHTVDTDFGSARSPHAADVDGDGDLDILGADLHGKTAWWENRGGQFALPTTNTAPPYMNPDTTDDVLAIEVAHRGRSGDGDLELVTLELLFQGCYGVDCTPTNLTNAQAFALLERILIYRDDGSGTFEPGSDTLVATVDPLWLPAGVQTVTFDDGDPGVQVAHSNPQTYFVVLDRADTPPSLTEDRVDRFTVTHLTEASSSAEDRDHDIGLTLEYATNVTTNLILDDEAKWCEPISDLSIFRNTGLIRAYYYSHFLAVAAGTIPRSYDWKVDGAPPTLDMGSHIYQRFEIEGTHTLQVTVENACGQASAELEVEVHASPHKTPDLSGSYKTASLTTVERGDILTYTLLLRNSRPVMATTTLTDPIPTNSTYVADSAYASDGGAVTYSGGQLHWYGEVISGTPVLVEFAVEVQPAPVGSLLTNTAYLDDGYHHTTLLETHSTFNPGYRLSINDGALYTNVPTVTLRHLWNPEDEISHVKFSNDGGLGASGNTTDWLPVDAQDTLYEGWVLATYGDLLMPRTTYAVFRDVGGIQYGPLQDDIIYDPEPPQVDDLKTHGPPTMATMRVHANEIMVRVTASDDNSGLDELHLSTNPSFEHYSTFPITGSVTDVPWDPQGSDRVYVRVVDRAGNVSATESVPVSIEYRVHLPISLKEAP